MFDIFYTGEKPNIFAHEQPAADLDDASKKSRTKFFWLIYGGNDYSGFNFHWRPPIWEEPHVHIFPSQWQKDSGVYFANKYTTHEKIWHYRDEQIVKRTAQLDIFYVDKNNSCATQRFESLAKKYPTLKKVRFANSWFDTIKRCANKAVSPDFWVISSENVYDDFNFDWHPNAWQESMTHVFGSKWQTWADTFIINKNEFVQHSKWVKNLDEFQNLNFVTDQLVTRPDDLNEIYYIDHYNADSKSNLEKIQNRYPTCKCVRFVDNYLDTLKRVVSHATTEYVWVISSVCDYSRFDFTWQPEHWRRNMLHVFPSNGQKFGDTFYFHVPSLKAQINDLELLEWYDTVHFCDDQTVPRFPMEQVYYSGDSVVPAIKSHKFDGPYALFQCIDPTAELNSVLAPSIWRKKDRSIHVLADGGGVLIAPRDAKAEINTQCYEYPYIQRQNPPLFTQKPLDIVYISNGEPDAERWFTHLSKVVEGRNIHRVKDVNGRSAAYKAAASLSSTPWFFAVFAKLEVNPSFNWDWQPDRLQEPKHYIFHAKNPLNGLEYGHMSMIAYNKMLTLNTSNPGLDFTLSSAHEVVPVLSGTAHYNVDEWTTWRTSFREVLKLKEYSINSPNDINAEYRLNVWCTEAKGLNAEWSIRGALDALEYYQSCNGDYEQLLKSFEWDFLRTIFDRKYK